MENVLLSVRQFRLLIVFSTMSTAFFLLPTVLITNAKQHAWLVPLWTGIVGIGSSLLWVYLATKYPKLNLIQICRSVTGKYVGTVIGLLLIFQMVLLCAWILNNLDDFMATTMLPHTDEWIFGACFLVIAVYSTIKGIESIARTTEFLAPILIIAFIGIFLLVMKNWDGTHLTPLLEFDWDGIFRKSSFMIAFPYMDAFSFIMIFPYVKAKPGFIYLQGASIATLFLSTITFILIGVLGVSRASHLTFPLFSMAQELLVSPFLEHLEAIISLQWLILVFIKLALTFYCVVIGLVHTFNLNNRGMLSLPLAIIMLGLSQSMHQNIIENMEWVEKYILLNHSFFAVCIPALLIIIHFTIRRRRV
ncbi:GerAB/ArcD/ProY family transporter [Paenibacillus agricola]|uniref:Endospore germination permease n=1 Tax=Paenibacillus agricola TaxID=2716264 RepID=A0ABX0J8I0_9BACL|nr:endospore germination permease [Paenibacillus agricola]NHN31489.1 endospore germination permease [Paenibacillus agricola]